MWSNLRRPLSPNRMILLLSTVAKLSYYIYNKSRSPSGGGVQAETYHAAGSYSAHTLINSSRWWGPRMEESRVRYSKLSIMTATNRFSIWRKCQEKRLWRSRSRKNNLKISGSIRLIVNYGWVKTLIFRLITVWKIDPGCCVFSALTKQQITINKIFYLCCEFWVFSLHSKTTYNMTSAVRFTKKWLLWTFMF